MVIGHLRTLISGEGLVKKIGSHVPWVCVLGLCTFPCLVSAQGTERDRLSKIMETYQNTTIQIPRVEGPVKIDGDLQDPAWRNAAAVDIAWQFSPIGAVPAKVKTTALIMEDGEHLYVGFNAEDPDPKAIRAFLRERDALFADDYVGIAIDTTGDATRAFEFFSNALGVQGDAIADVQTGEDFSFEAIFQTSGQITDQGFEVEFAIPLSQIRFPKREGQQQWKVLFTRTYPRDRRYQSFQFPVDRDNACFMCQFQPAQGLIGATPGKRFQIVPTATATAHQSKNPLDRTNQRETN